MINHNESFSPGCSSLMRGRLAFVNKKKADGDRFGAPSFCKERGERSMLHFASPLLNHNDYNSTDLLLHFRGSDSPGSLKCRLLLVEPLLLCLGYIMPVLSLVFRERFPCLRAFLWRWRYIQFHWLRCQTRAKGHNKTLLAHNDIDRRHNPPNSPIRPVQASASSSLKNPWRSEHNSI